MLVDVSNLVGPHHSFPRSGKKMMDIFPSCAVPWVKPARPQLGFCDKDLWFEGTRTANPCFFLGGDHVSSFSRGHSWFFYRSQLIWLRVGALGNWSVCALTPCRWRTAMQKSSKTTVSGCVSGTEKQTEKDWTPSAGGPWWGPYFH